MKNISTNMNGSTNYLTMSSFPDAAYASMLVINLIGILGNVLLIVAHVKDPLRLLKSPSSTFIFNIALVDVLLSCFFLVTATRALAGIKKSPDWDDSLASAILHFLFSLFYSTVFASYVGLAIERFLSVAYPLWHRTHITRSVCRCWVVGIWLFIAGLRLTDFVLIRTMKFTSQSQLSLIVFMCVMLLLTICFYIASYISTRKQSLKIQRKTDMNEATKRTFELRLQNEKHFLFTIAIACFVLAGAVLPFVTASFIFFNYGMKEEKWFDNRSYIILFVLLFFNSSVNVFLYLWKLPKYRKTFKKLYCDC